MVSAYLSLQLGDLVMLYSRQVVDLRHARSTSIGHQVLESGHLALQLHQHNHNMFSFGVKAPLRANRYSSM